ncbi:MAG: DUF2292 domain-containing protein [Verrucomicrobia bacterium]|nr:MAG: DUF2292 domain-containing protein [Verrucomicrobiota bacterium]TAE88572.1 MAG: DUF2292 domain-containing protein [Verrucomicrobiota bacterium]TAF27027.1 MAG: DUF2292 domain-containing protein [Verrucomicrobiota bacterium]TAF42283.1 MAG: DUF2292 domain-containing protein [Verrucomicrobiota bacterium]
MSPNSHDRTQADATPDWLDVVRRNVESLRYGSVQITVHDGRVTQIESVERTRFTTSRDESGRPA